MRIKDWVELFLQTATLATTIYFTKKLVNNDTRRQNLVERDQEISKFKLKLTHAMDLDTVEFRLYVHEIVLMNLSQPYLISEAYQKLYVENKITKKMSPADFDKMIGSILKAIYEVRPAT